ncbi:Monogalactosyldiacylglycerol synthase [Sulfobacillus acidophilus DSM 10332]|uniref:Monogalactosyldiacylglycerol synthase n=1 Tax=Sulfobacillus acidophilus (strain ATCC 700253 / DSM 10332 / NAL) TaxID=679936 RepID=G8TVW5_SULAD|nr:Monogalactosyldiacylglycerol synthase [Sulfobacillus acidophilus DSM 10332]
MEHSMAASEEAMQSLAQWIDWLPNHHDATLNSRPDVMVLAARYGDGHLRAAKAIGLALLLHNPAIKLGILDYYKFVNPRLDNMIRWVYLTSVRFAPDLWRWFYTATQRIDPESGTQKFLNSIGLEQFYRAISPKPPKVIISTYPTAAGVVSTLKKQGRLDVANYVVMTDYSIHSQWIHPAVDKYFVGGQDMLEALAARGISREKVVVSGIPVDSRFREPVDAVRVRQQLGIGEEPVILFMGGSYMPLPEFSHVLSQIDRVTAPHVTVVVAGREENRKKLALQYQRDSKHPMVVLGYVNNVHELMGISSLLISKAGGLTTTEALCRGVPMLIYRPIPGQEDANAGYLVKHGAGILAKDQDDVSQMVEHLLTHPDDLRKMADRARELGHPDAADIVAEHTYQALLGREAHGRS